jgi:hypothetical protein
MDRLRCAWSFPVVAIVVAQLLYNPTGYAQEPPAGEPEVQVQDSNVAPPPAFVPARPGQGAPTPVAGPVVLLRADTPKARLQAQGPGQWRDVCATPCNVPVNPAAVYRIGGNTIVPSDSFSMPRPSGQVVIEARYGSKVKHWVGIAMIIVGAVNALTGAFYYSQANDLASSAGGNGDPDFYRAAGVVGIAAGVIVAGIGIPLALSSTSVDVR